MQRLWHVPNIKIADNAIGTYTFETMAILMWFGPVYCTAPRTLKVFEKDVTLLPVVVVIWYRARQLVVRFDL